MALLDANLLSDTYGSLEGSYADFHDLAADRPAVVSIAHPDWIGVLSAAVSLIWLGIDAHLDLAMPTLTSHLEISYLHGIDIFESFVRPQYQEPQ